MSGDVTNEQVQVIKDFLAAGDSPESIGHTLARLADLGDIDRLRFERIAREIQEGRFVPPVESAGGDGAPDREPRRPGQQQ